jgi:hypothetical protein
MGTEGAIQELLLSPGIGEPSFEDCSIIYLDLGKDDAHPRWGRVCGDVTYSRELCARMRNPHPYVRSRGERSSCLHETTGGAQVARN